MATKRPFPTDPRTRWITVAGEDDRRMELLEPFSFHDEARVWTAPKGHVVDGASIPRALWALVGSPFTGRYRRASIVHDWGCDEAVAGRADRREVDRMFYRACRAGGCSPGQAAMLYAGVRIGAWHRLNLPGVVEVEGPRLELDSYERQVIEEYRQIAGSLDVRDAPDDAQAVELAVDRAQAKYFARLAAAEQAHAVARATIR